MSQNEEDEEIISNLDEDELCFSREEVTALLKECEHSYISYFNPIARQVVSKMVKFVYNL